MVQRFNPAVLTVGIIGGSIVGCTLAAELARLGCRVRLFERSGEALKDRGAGIGVPESAMATFATQGLIDASLPHFPAPAFLRIWKTPAAPRFGRLAWTQPAKLAALNWGALYRNLRARVPPGVYQTRQQVVALTEPVPGEVLLDFAELLQVLDVRLGHEA